MIINADDFGYSESVNSAIAYCFEHKMINRTTIMVNMPYAEQAAQLAREKGFFDCVGLHINLTEGRALTEICRKSPLCDENGYLKGTFHRPIKSRLYLNKQIRDAIYAETEAQIKKFLNMGFTLMHADSHNYTHVYFSIYTSVRKQLKKYGFKSVRISRNIPEDDFSLAFKIYKCIFNFCIKRLKINGKKVFTTKYFGSVEDFENLENPQEHKDDIEFMTHPDYIDGVLTDNTLPNPHPFRDAQWLEQNGLQLEDVSGKKLKLLVTFIQVHIGGAMTSLVNFLNSLDTEKYDVDVIFYEDNGERNGIKEGINILPQGRKNKKEDISNILSKAISPVYVWSKIKEQYYKKIKPNTNRAIQIMSKQGCKYCPKLDKEYDAVIAFEQSWALNFAMTKVNAKKRLIWFHNDFDNAGFSYKISRKQFEQADALVFVSEECKNSFAQNHPELKNKVYCMPNILATDYVKNRGDAQDVELEFANQNDLKFISVARVNFAEKGFDRAADVFYKLKKDGLLNNVKWIVVGEGADSDAFKSMIKQYELEDVVHCVGLKTNPIPYMKKCDILFLPSRHEGKPMVVTEGFIMGLVPVVTNFTSASGQIRSGVDGLIFENSKDGLYEGLKKLLSDRCIVEELKKNVANTEYGNEKDIAIFDDIIKEIYD